MANFGGLGCPVVHILGASGRPYAADNLCDMSYFELCVCDVSVHLKPV